MVPVFNKERHSYIDPSDQMKYESVTRWVNKFKKPFDRDRLAERSAKKQGITAEQVLANWDKLRDDSASFGTFVHKALETYFLTGKTTSENEQIVENFHLLDLKFDNVNTAFEQIVYDKDIQIAGTADVIEHVGNDMFNVYDFKTNKNLRISSKYDEQMIGPVSHLPGTEYFVYSMQLSMYAYLYEKMTGRTCCRLRILWLNRANIQDYTDFTGIWKIYSIPYLKEDVINCIKYYQDF
jgi:hypothetical protein